MVVAVMEKVAVVTAMVSMVAMAAPRAATAEAWAVS